MDPHRPRTGPGRVRSFTHSGTGWRLHLPRPPIDRMEYLLEVADHNGNRATITDPANPPRAPGAFGDKSVVQSPVTPRPLG